MTVPTRTLGSGNNRPASRRLSHWGANFVASSYLDKLHLGTAGFDAQGVVAFKHSMVPTASFQRGTTLDATGAAAVSH